MRRNRLRTILRDATAFGVAVACLALASGVAHACPTCGSGMAEAGEEGRKMLNGWFWSIIFMMSMPFTILTLLGGYMYYLVRKARAASESAATVPAVNPSALNASPTPMPAPAAMASANADAALIGQQA